MEPEKTHGGATKSNADLDFPDQEVPISVVAKCTTVAVVR